MRLAVREVGGIDLPDPEPASRDDWNVSQTMEWRWFATRWAELPLSERAFPSGAAPEPAVLRMRSLADDPYEVSRCDFAAAHELIARYRRTLEAMPGYVDCVVGAPAEGSALAANRRVPHVLIRSAGLLPVFEPVVHRLLGSEARVLAPQQVETHGGMWLNGGRAGSSRGGTTRGLV